MLNHELVLVLNGVRPCAKRYRSTSIHMCYVFSKGMPHHINVIADRPNVSAGTKARFYQRKANGSVIQWKGEKRVPPFGV